MWLGSVCTLLTKHLAHKVQAPPARLGVRGDATLQTPAFTGSSFSGEDAASEVRTLIERCHSVELQVLAITSDMGSGNRAMWKQFGVHAGRYSRTVNLIPHPQVPGEQIAFLTDVPHLIKDLNRASAVSLQPAHQLAEFQKNLTFKLVPELCPELLNPNHFEKMKILLFTTAGNFDDHVLEPLERERKATGPAFHESAPGNQQFPEPISVDFKFKRWRQWSSPTITSPLQKPTYHAGHLGHDATSMMEEEEEEN
ncbi:hypothetical protein HPB47_020877 [Ixodes persulcatus]|uniref:Uncharacterized protein n=1 Tax=Ixodes persulcatus TaxID=34615 RepID=A0AC60QE86_IXOPE|nr:hypothetical protein HPB47_020877 [Ixodes persulcatus]